MPQEKQTKTNTRKILLVIIFILMIGFGFGKGEKVEAADELGDCISNLDGFKPIWQKYDISQNDCTNECNQKMTELPSITGCKWKPYSKPVGTVGKIAAGSDEPKNDACSGTDWVHMVDCTLLALLRFFVWLTTLSSTIFSWIMNPDSITSILSSNAIYSSWALVRDALNVSFIMFLLFSAFATIFQIDKYSYKKTLLTVVIMALLVNFSFPISRFIIDVSNMMMFYFSKTLNIGTEKAQEIVNFADVAGLPGILKPAAAAGSGTTALLAAIVFVFIFAVTILTISILFLIRTIALAILIIFSSLAFIGTAIPPLSSYANDWWKKLFSYSFFGPIMLFTMYIASSLMTEISKVSKVDMAKIATANTSMPEYIANLSYFSIPIVILWMGLGIAQSMSIAGAGAVVGKAQGFMKGAGKWAASPITGAYKAGKFGAGAGVSLVGRGLAKNKVGKFLLPRVYKEAWERRFKDAEQKAYGPAIGQMQNLANKVLGGPKTDYEKLEKARLVANQKKENEEVSQNADFIMDNMFNNMNKGPREAVVHMRAGLSTLFNNKDYDDFMWRIHNNLDEPIYKGGKTFRDLGFDENNTTVSQEDILNAVKTLMKESGATDKEIDQELLDIDAISAGGAGLGFGGSRYNSTKKDFQRTNSEEGAWIFARKLRTMGESQELVRKMHRNIFTNEHGGLNKTGEEALFHVINSGITKNLDRTRADFYNEVAGNDEVYKKILDFADKVKNGTAELWDDTQQKRVQLSKMKKPDGTNVYSTTDLQAQAKNITEYIHQLRDRTGKARF